MKRRQYEEALDPLELELNALARWLHHTGRRMAVLFEGRDAAGKGGVIGLSAERLNELPPLGHSPRRERFTGKVRPSRELY